MGNVMIDSRSILEGSGKNVRGRGWGRVKSVMECCVTDYRIHKLTEL